MVQPLQEHFWKPHLTSAMKVLDEITQILSDLYIKTELFDQDEYEKAMKSLVEGKGCREDDIPMEALERQGLGDIVLVFCNRNFVQKSFTLIVY